MTRSVWGSLVPPAALLVLLLAAVPRDALAAQQPTHSGAVDLRGVTPARVPFGPGERATYQVRLGGIGVGRGSMQLVGLETVDGRPTYRARLQVAGGIPLARVDNTFESWIDVQGLFSRRYRQDQKEVRFERRRLYHFFPEHRRYRTSDGENGTLPTNRPLDEVSFLYYARTLPLEVGQTYTLHQYFKESGNPVILKVLRRETVTVPAGTFRTIVVQPIIRTRGLFGEGGEAQVYFTDDERRILVQLRSRVPVVGALSLHLQEYHPGQQLTGTELPAGGRALE